jgi:hypothetical protein
MNLVLDDVVEEFEGEPCLSCIIRHKWLISRFGNARTVTRSGRPARSKYRAHKSDGRVSRSVVLQYRTVSADEDRAEIENPFT